MLKKLNAVANGMAELDAASKKGKAPKHQKAEDESLEGANDTSLEEQKEGDSDKSMNVDQAPKLPGKKMSGKQVAAMKAKKGQ
jgi:hypothetical protein